MIDGTQFIGLVKKNYSFLNTDFNLKIICEKVRGNAFYDVQYGDREKIISINYENIEDYFQVIIFKLQNGKLPDYDDKVRTLHLDRLNLKVLSHVEKRELLSNNDFFSQIKTSSELERKLLKSAKELRICLNHFDIL